MVKQKTRMDITKEIQGMITDSAASVSKEWLDEAKVKYPYFTLPALLYLYHNQDKEGLDENVLSKLAISFPDRRALFDILGENAEKFASFYPPEPKPKQMDTDSTLDTFLSTYGNSDEKELELLNRMIFNPVPDYAQILAAEEERSKPTQTDLSSPQADSDDILINRFILKSKEKPGYFLTEESAEEPVEEQEVEAEPIEAPAVSDDSMLSESLAKIYIKQRKYSKALEIIKTISLKYPEKSIYFADQIRFLRKLVKTEKYINNK